MNIVFCLDDNYSILLGVAINSLLLNAKPADKFHLYVLHNGLSENSINGIMQLKTIRGFEVDFITVDEQRYFSEFDVPGLWKNKVCYYRLRLPQIIADFESGRSGLAPSRLLFIDADIIVTGPIGEMYDTDLNGAVMGAVRSPRSGDGDDNEYIATLHLSPLHHYFYAGLMLIDTGLWLKEKIFEKCVEANKSHAALKWADMDILNLVFDGDAYRTLPAKYSVWPGLNIDPYVITNFDDFKKPYDGVYPDAVIKEAFSHPVIFQLAGGAKPWRRCALFGTVKLFYRYAKGTVWQDRARQYLKNARASRFVKIKKLLVRIMLLPVLNKAKRQRIYERLLALPKEEI
ncbi:UDP-glucose--(galactosyl) LPS alpha1,2-glucosyltransferase [Planctomycetales bacterium]|nr:UDP-glucose--(galactosyl) LPS alpha1,2-glucosyltransferase [Planctomycetales bacterium]GHT00416.1 UDP-glucose--(galactosyl) LPS alpha1,2-glucosyltransferase [Planctomycetales bacterium]GHT07509.1 UDP-glucose--(galactosyl) LPS alpha1,2-glucosyltransferase [Planctomycetales bacterium]